MSVVDNANQIDPATGAGDKVAAKLGVAPGAPPDRRKRQRAGLWLKRFLTVSQLLDPIRIPNKFVNYNCVFWKSISGNDKTSPVFDHGLASDLLPPVTRLVVAAPFVSLYPRYHHANVELRTAYLDSAMDAVIQRDIYPKQKKIRIVLLGCGYDLRSVRMANKYEAQGNYEEMELIELDLPEVIEAKRELLQKRFSKRRPELKGWTDKIQTFGVDLNDTDRVSDIVNGFLAEKDDDSYYTIFVFEAVLVYLDQGVPSRLLRILSDALRKNGRKTGCVCFADVLSNVEDDVEGAARKELRQNGWDLQDFLPKPGKTRHMGWATCLP